MSSQESNTRLPGHIELLIDHPSQLPEGVKIEARSLARELVGDFKANLRYLLEEAKNAYNTCLGNTNETIERAAREAMEQLRFACQYHEQWMQEEQDDDR